MAVSEIQKELLNIIDDFDKVCTKYDIWYMLASGSVLGAVRHKGFIPWDSDLDVFVKYDDLAILRGVMKKELPQRYNYIQWDTTQGYSLPFDRLTYHDVVHHKLHLDIFPIIGAPSNQTLRKIFTKMCFLSYKAYHCKHADVRYSAPAHVKQILLAKKFTRLIPDWLFKTVFKVLSHSFPLDAAEYYYYISSGYGYKASMKKELIMETEKLKFEDLMLPIPKYWDEYLTNLYGDYMTPIKDFKKI